MKNSTLPQTCDQNNTFTWTPSLLFKNDSTFECLKDFRMDIYNRLGDRKNASMDIIDALSCRQDSVQSVIALSTQPQFIRKYASISDAIRYPSGHIDGLKDCLQKWGLKSLSEVCIENKYHPVIAADITPTPHPYAHCLPDRIFIHDASNQVTGKPINIGHQYSSVVGIGEDRTWVSPLRFDRIPSGEKAAQFCMQKTVEVCLEIPDKNPIALLDSGFNNAPCLRLAAKAKNTIMVIRSACNRSYCLPVSEKGNKKYGEKLNLYNPGLGAKADVSFIMNPKDNKGSIAVFYWKEVCSRQKGINGYEYPSALLVIFELRSDGSQKYRKPIVLRIFAPEEVRFNAANGAWLYYFRFAIEHFFAVKKQRLLFGKYESANEIYQETFALLSTIAYTQWNLARSSGDLNWSIRPWERYPKSNPKGSKLSPAHVQRGFDGVLKIVGTPSTYKPPKCIPPGRSVGTTMKKRPKCPVIKKGVKIGKEISIDESVNSNAQSMCQETRSEALKIVPEIIKNSLIVLFLVFAYFVMQFEHDPQWKLDKEFEEKMESFLSDAGSNDHLFLDSIISIYFRRLNERTSFEIQGKKSYDRANLAIFRASNLFLGLNIYPRARGPTVLA